MKILGIDPGTKVMGYGVIETDDDNVALVEYGVIVPPDKTEIAARLSYIFKELQSVISRHRPDSVAVEQPFVAKNVRSALAIGRAQAVALLAAADRNIPACEYTPAQIKQRVANYGASSKEQIQEMVRLQLGLSEVPQPDDAADALAVAICHCQEMHVADMLSMQEENR
jgi:crossover junction endodeoxyribonuclease RuvC